MKISCPAASPACPQTCVPPSPLDAPLPYTLQMSTAFLDNVYAAWEETGKMYEKFSAVEVGVPGAGGEYKAAWGFGWTNGAVLDLLERFGVM